MTASIFREEALAHQHERLWGDVIISRPTSWRVLTALIAVGVIVAAFFLITNDYTRRETVRGFLVPTKGVVAIYAPQPGLLSELYTQEGNFVAQGSDLFKIQIDQKIAAGNYISQEILDELQQQKHRLTEAIELEHDALASLLVNQEIGLRKIAAELFALQTQIKNETALQLIEQHALNRAHTLHTRGAISNADMDNVEKNYLERQQQLQNLQASLASKQFAREEASTISATYLIDNKKKISELQNRVSELDRQIAAAEVEQSTVIRAPVSGIVTTLLSSLGQKLDGSTPVISIIPENSRLEAHLYVPTSAIGFIRENQNVNLRYAAFPFQRFGLFAGSVTQVTSSILSENEVPSQLPVKEPVYRVTANIRAQTINAYGQQVALKPGMLLTADIELDKRSLFEWLLAPLYSLKGRL
ncbi:MAG: HlyD family efflux transporter periplasmic adaptor subunit [Pseudomonadota bacterium]